MAGSHLRMESHLFGGNADPSVADADPGLYCRQRCVSRILEFFDRPPIETSALATLDGSAATARLLRGAGLAVHLCVPALYLAFSPRLWRAWTEAGPARRTMSIARYRKWAARPERTALLLHSSAHELYGIAELWSHCVCEFRTKGHKAIVFDPYEDGLARDYPQRVTPTLSPKRLSDLHAIRLVVFDLPSL
jgi:hypothetical protein